MDQSTNCAVLTAIFIDRKWSIKSTEISAAIGAQKSAFPELDSRSILVSNSQFKFPQASLRKELATGLGPKSSLHHKLRILSNIHKLESIPTCVPKEYSSEGDADIGTLAGKSSVNFTTENEVSRG